MTDKDPAKEIADFVKAIEEFGRLYEDAAQKLVQALVGDDDPPDTEPEEDTYMIDVPLAVMNEPTLDCRVIAIDEDAAPRTRRLPLPVKMFVFHEIRTVGSLLRVWRDGDALMGMLELEHGVSMSVLEGVRIPVPDLEADTPHRDDDGNIVFKVWKLTGVKLSYPEDYPWTIRPDRSVTWGYPDPRKEVA